MVHDAADVPVGPASLDSVGVVFDEQRLIIPPLRFFNRARNVLLANWLNGVVHYDLENFSRCGTRTETDSCNREKKQECRKRPEDLAGRLAHDFAPCPYSLSIQADRGRISWGALGAAPGETSECASVHPGRYVLPVINRAPRSYVT